jgi:hypothetical protein
MECCSGVFDVPSETPAIGCWILSRREAKRRMGETARSAFVPEGLNDRSQAIYCLVSVQKGEPSHRARYDRVR